MGRSGGMFSIWIGAGIMGFGASIYGAETGHDITLLFLVTVIAALIGTVMVWAEPAITARRTHPKSGEKAKHNPGDRLTLLLDMMDAEERAAFKETLKRRVLEDYSPGGDGELPYDAESLSALLNGRGEGRST